MKINKIYMIFWAICLSIPSIVQAGPTIIFDGTDLPENQGWIKYLNYSNGTAHTSVEDGIFTMDTTVGDGHSTAIYMKYVGKEYYFRYSVRLRIIESGGHNLNDASFCLGPYGFDSMFLTKPMPYHGGPPRGGMLYFDEYAVGNTMAMNYQSFDISYTIDTTDNFHLYTLEVKSDYVDVFIDNNSVFTYYSPETIITDGFLFFGDQCNEFGLDSQVEIDYITYERLETPWPVKPIPAPSSILLGGSGIGLLVLIRKKLT